MQGKQYKNNQSKKFRGRGKYSKEIVILQSQYSSEIKIDAGSSFYSPREDFDWWSDFDSGDSKNINLNHKSRSDENLVELIAAKSESIEEEKVLSNPLILKKVLGYLDENEDLLNCRVVSSDWKSFATEILLQRKSVTIGVRFSVNLKGYCKQIVKSRGSRFCSCYFDEECLKNFPLKDLIPIINSSSKFPCVSFEITAGDLESSDISSFLQLYGDKIEKLGLDLGPQNAKYSSGWNEKCSSHPKISTVRNILCRQLPNLKDLEIFNLNDDNNNKSPENFYFANLFEEFEFELDSPGEKEQENGQKLMLARLGILEKLGLNIHYYHKFHIEEPRNSETPKIILQENMLGSKTVEFRGSSVDLDSSCKDCVRALISTNQLDKLSELCTRSLGLPLLERIVDECPSQLRLHSVYIEFETVVELIMNRPKRKRMARVLNSILNNFSTEKTQDSDRAITIIRPLGFLSDSDFQIPVLKNVHTLNLEKTEEDEWEIPAELIEQMDQINLSDISFFPSGFNLSHSFPNLKTVCLGDWPGELPCELWGENIQSLPTVTSFCLFTRDGPTQEFSEAAFSKLPEIFPKLTQIEISKITNFPAIARFLWKFQELELVSIRLDAHRSASFNSNQKGAIDAGITGFSMETCQNLRRSKKFLKWARKAAGIEVKRDEEAQDKGKKKKKAKKKNREQIPEITKEKGPLKLPKWLASLRVNPSICDLTKLKRLHLKFSDRDENLNGSYCLISELSSLFAFHLMPQLHVVIDHWAPNKENRKRMNSHLEKMSPYFSMNFDDYYDEFDEDEE